MDGEVKTHQISDHTSSNTGVVEPSDVLPNSEDTNGLEPSDALLSCEELKKSKRKHSDQFSLDKDEELLKKYSSLPLLSSLDISGKENIAEEMLR